MMEFNRTSSFDWRMATDRTRNRGLERSAPDGRMPGWRRASDTGMGIAQPWRERLELYRKASFYKR
ncbi:hypothetical protein [Paenibacillus sp. YPG26]|uniref:hypothetical protein n=1 Tax=Paenibacillus sp. YPG26 TaxID=2878915 RepID=UPI00203F3628|nr:hypothetical protein [Paenibacillus sp. YPG26]USB32602.1 hypothetical protein LDO05_15195 [Paenibacillus sp. YPG26]